MSVFLFSCDEIKLIAMLYCYIDYGNMLLPISGFSGRVDTKLTFEKNRFVSKGETQREIWMKVQ